MPRAEFFQLVLSKSADYPEKVAMVKFWHRVAVAVWSPEDTEVILGSSKHLDKAIEYRFFQPWLGGGLLISSGRLRRRSQSEQLETQTEFLPISF